MNINESGTILGLKISRPGAELVNPEQIGYKLIFTSYDSFLHPESPNSATLGQNLGTQILA